MAKPLPNEFQLYERIKNEQIGVHPLIWDTIYHFLGDYISVVNGLVSYYIEKNEPIPVQDAKRILEYTAKIKQVIHKVLHPETIHQDLPQMERIKTGHLSLHPVIKDFFMHHIGNDTHVINLCASFYLDPIDEQPIPVKDAKKILEYAQSMALFLDKLHHATQGHAVQ